MENQVKVELTKQEEQELQDGQALYEMTKTAGYQVIKQKLEELSFHSWVDPRETTNEKEWMWREMVAWAGANVARELVEWITKIISTSEYLEKKKKGEIKVKSMRIV